MRMYPGKFSPIRAQMPERRAEKRVYEALAAADRQGFVYYEWRRGYRRIEVDFAVWVEGLGRFALQVKGGHYVLYDGEWHLRTRRGWKPVDVSPLDGAWLGALDLHDDIAELGKTPYNPFVIGVVLFPDMEPDEAIVRLARRKGVYLLWGSGDPIRGLEEVARSRGTPGALGMERIGREVHAVTDGLIVQEAGDGENAVQGAGDVVGSQPLEPFMLSLSVGGMSIIRVRGQLERVRMRSVSDRG